jgi:hypothetical protein
VRSVRCGWEIVVLAALAAALLGCGQKPTGPERGVVHGKITLDGNPVVKGTIDFAPTDPSRGPTCGMRVVDGQYASAERGPIIGKCRVTIRAPQMSGTMREDGDWKSNYAELIPPRYNTQSTLEADVRAGDNTFDFDLKSR